VPEWERISAEMQIVAERMVRGEYTPAAAGAEINRRADRLLEKRRWMIEQGRAAYEHGVEPRSRPVAWTFGVLHPHPTLPPQAHEYVREPGASWPRR
jgi:hypothetical protein